MMGVLPGGKGRGAENPNTEVFCRGLPPDTTDADLLEIFSPFGAIPPRGVKAMQGEGGVCSGIGFIDFRVKEQAMEAVNRLNGAFTPDGSSSSCALRTAEGKG